MNKPWGLFRLRLALGSFIWNYFCGLFYRYTRQFRLFFLIILNSFHFKTLARYGRKLDQLPFDNKWRYAQSLFQKRKIVFHTLTSLSDENVLRYIQQLEYSLGKVRWCHIYGDSNISTLLLRMMALTTEEIVRKSKSFHELEQKGNLRVILRIKQFYSSNSN